MQVRVIVPNLWMLDLVLIVDNVMVPLHLVDEPVHKLVVVKKMLLISFGWPLESRMVRQAVSFVMHVMGINMNRLFREPRAHMMVFSVVGIEVLAIELVLAMPQRSPMPIVPFFRLDVALNEVIIARVLGIVDALDTER